MTVDYAVIESLLKDANNHLNQAWTDLEKADDLLPPGMTGAVAQERIRQAKKMINSLRNQLDEQKTQSI